MFEIRTLTFRCEGRVRSDVREECNRRLEKVA
jgi:hypothetical protein